MADSYKMKVNKAEGRFLSERSSGTQCQLLKLRIPRVFEHVERNWVKLRYPMYIYLPLTRGTKSGRPT